MGELVGDDVGDELLLVLRARRRVDEQQVLAERDAAEVLHRAGGEVGEGDQVDLVARVGDAVVRPGTSAGRTRRHRAPNAGEVALAGHVDDAQRDAVDVDGVGHLERPDDEGDEVGAHHHRVGEADHGAVRPRWCVRPRGRSRSPCRSVVDDEGDAEHGLELGFVPAREGPPAVGRLHLGGGDDLLGAVVVDVRAAVEAAELVVEDADEVDRRAGTVPGASASGGRTTRRSVSAVEFPGRGDPVDRDSEVIVELDGVEHEDVGVASTTSRSIVDAAGERGVGEVGTQAHVVAGRACAVREAERVERVEIHGGHAIAWIVPVAWSAVPDLTRRFSNRSSASVRPTRFDVVGIGNALVDVIAPAEDDFLDDARAGQGFDDADRDRAGRGAVRARSDRAVEMSGGSAANTMCGIASFGGRAAYIGKVNGDDLGDVFGHDLRAVGVHVPTGRPASTGRRPAAASSS